MYTEGETIGNENTISESWSMNVSVSKYGISWIKSKLGSVEWDWFFYLTVHMNGILN